MPLLKDMEVLEVSHKYNLSPGGMKAQAFTLFERGCVFRSKTAGLSEQTGRAFGVK